MPLAPLLSRYDHLILDLDGTVWVGEEPTPRAARAVEALRAAGKSLSFVTNDGRHPPEEYVRRLWAIGCRAALAEIVTVGAAIQHVLAGRPSQDVYVIGSDAVIRHVADAGHRILNGTARAHEAETVVVVAHDDFTYGELTTATRAVIAGATMLAGGRDATFPTAGGASPGTGALVAALEYATGHRALSVGKPEPQMFRTALDRLPHPDPSRTLVVGDRLDADLAGAAAAGLDGAIVLTGTSTRQQAETADDPAPVAVASDLATLVLTA